MEGLLSVSPSYPKADSKIVYRLLFLLRHHLTHCFINSVYHSEQDMAETDPKSVQDLTNVVSRDRDTKLALASIA